MEVRFIISFTCMSNSIIIIIIIICFLLKYIFRRKKVETHHLLFINEDRNFGTNTNQAPREIMNVYIFVTGLVESDI